jgi:Protein of unknown function (DUF3098)
MSTVSKTPAQTQAPKAATSNRIMPAANTEPRGNQVFLFDRSNYMWMIGGVALILIGFMLMSGGKSPDPHQFLYSEIYSFRRITLAPIVVLLGFAVEVYAIMKKPTEQTIS